MMMRLRFNMLTQTWLPRLDIKFNFFVSRKLALSGIRYHRAVIEFKMIHQVGNLSLTSYGDCDAGSPLQDTP